MKITVRDAAVLAIVASHARAALSVDFGSTDSIKAAAKTVAANLMGYYKGDQPGETPGILPGPPPHGAYYWWEGGALWGTIIDYWHYTGDTTYNDETQRSLVFQANSPANNFMPPNWTASLGNDDQGFWGMSAMLAAESNFQNPPEDQPQWLALAQAVFNTQASRWDTKYCAGGLRWQIPLSNNGYNYKNSIANAVFFNIAARLARYTGNSSYADWATKTWDWTVAMGYIDADYNIFDGAHTDFNCTDINRAQFSYTAAAFIQGAGFMYSFTNGAQFWADHLQYLTNRTLEVFFPRGIMKEVACELENLNQCTADMLSYKGYVHRWLASTTLLAPFMHDTIMPVLLSSAKGMAQSCRDDSGTCGFRWDRGGYDGVTGAGQQMNALGALTSLLVQGDKKAPVTNNTGGTSIGDPSAGAGTDVVTEGEEKKISTTDKIVSWVVTGIIAFLCGLWTIFMITDVLEGPRRTWQGPMDDGHGRRNRNGFRLE
ncbi:putative glycoside hydrolase [Podospora fimiseda]|uniref:Mannan endo-1,6-alpha-mannosidase n=1 Tax=Podospora fimiseda TaxID=252190 RepID=A0AAN7BPH7_9PEZI|nr:putative glycoside hydrolase [Podospora fimiseda]